MYHEMLFVHIKQLEVTDCTYFYLTVILGARSIWYSEYQIHQVDARNTPTFWFWGNKKICQDSLLPVRHRCQIRTSIQGFMACTRCSSSRVSSSLLTPGLVGIDRQVCGWNQKCQIKYFTCIIYNYMQVWFPRSCGSDKIQLTTWYGKYM